MRVAKYSCDSTINHKMTSYEALTSSDVLISHSDSRLDNFIRLLLNGPLESHWIRGLKLTSKFRAVQFWVNWKKWQQNQNVVRQFQTVQWIQYHIWMVLSKSEVISALPGQRQTCYNWVLVARPAAAAAAMDPCICMDRKYLVAACLSCSLSSAVWRLKKGESLFYIISK